MIHRLRSAAISLALLVACFKVYQWLAVPMLEGPTNVPVAKMVTTTAPPPPTAKYRELIERFFAEDSWERRSAKILRSDQFLLLIRHWEQLDDHRLQITPCTIVFDPDGLDPSPSSTAVKRSSQRSWIIQADEGAILQLEQASDIRRGAIGAIGGVYIPGVVRLTASESQPGAKDALQLVTKHLQISDQKIWTPHDVHIRWAQNVVRGRDLTIHLNELGGGTKRSGLPFGRASLRSIELVHLEELRIQLPQRMTTDREAAGDDWLRAACDGSLVLDMLGGIARVNRNVQLTHIRQDQAFERLYCDELTARFTHWDAGDDAWLQLQLDRLVAIGKPVVVVAQPSVHDAARHREPRRFEFRCGKWEYDVVSGEFAAVGSGELRSLRLVPEINVAEEVLRWQRQLRWERAASDNGDGEMHLVIEGDATCQTAFGELKAERVRAWFDTEMSPPPAMVQRTPPPTRSSSVAREVSPATARPSFYQRNVAGVGRPNARMVSFAQAPRTLSMPSQPRRILAEGRVQARAPGLEAGTERLDVVLLASNRTAPLADKFAPDSSSFLAAPALELRAPANQVPGRPHDFQQNYQVYGESLHVNVRATDTGWQVGDVSLDGNVRCMAFRTERDQPPLAVELAGHALLLRELGVDRGIATITGKPATVRARGMLLEGPSIQLDRQQNRIWIDGAGRATLPLPEEIAKNYPQDAAVAYVTWLHQLAFDGSSIVCDREVQIRGPAQHLAAQRLLVELSRPVDLSQHLIDGSMIELKTIEAAGRVAFENRTLGPQGLQAMDAARVDRLTYDYKTGDFAGLGPGFLESIRSRQSAPQAAQGAQAIPLAGKSAGGSAAPLVYLRVDFERQLAGNVPRREAHFGNQIRATFGPVSDWTQTVVARPNQPLQAGQILLSCDQLSVFQLRRGNLADPAVEVVAQGNTIIEGDQFHARAHRLSYDQGKDLIVMDGNGQADVYLARQTRPGAAKQETSAAKIQFSPSANTIQVHGMKMLNLDGLGNSAR